MIVPDATHGWAVLSCAAFYGGRSDLCGKVHNVNLKEEAERMRRREDLGAFASSPW